MEVVEVEVGVGSQDGGELVTVTATVNTGYIHSMMPESLMSRLGVAPIYRNWFKFRAGGEGDYDWGMASF